MGRFRLLEHTADMGLAATGADPVDLFLAAARGLRAMLLGRRVPSPERWEPVKVTGDGREELLVNYLGEILIRLEVGAFLATAFEIEELSATVLRGRFGGCDFDPRRHALEREIKAITWHQLAVTESDGSWRARLYVDL